MKAGWEVKALGEVCDFRGGGTPSKKNSGFWGGDIPWVSPKDMKSDIISDSIDKVTAEAVEGSAAKYIPEGAILIVVRSGILARTIPTAISGRALTVNQDIKAMLPKKELDCEFLAYFFKASEQRLLDKVKRGATVHKLDMPVLKALPIPLPPLEEQKRIVAVLDAAFEGLTRARTHIETNLQNARELFQAKVLAEFAKLQEGFGKRQIGDIADHRLGKMLDKNKNQGEHRKYLRNTNVQWFEIGTSDLLEMRIEDSEIEKYSVLKGDLLICEGGYPGRAAIWTNDEPIFFQKALHRVRFEEPIYNKLLLYWLFFADQTGGLREYCSGAGILHFTGQSLAKFEMPFPSKECAEKAVKAIEITRLESEALQVHYTTKLQDLDDLRQSLLARAFAGELT